MVRRLGFFLAVLMGLAVMAGYAFQEPQQPPDQDQRYSMRLEQQIQEFLQKYPNSEFAPIARQCLKDMKEIRARGDWDIAQFYASRGNYAGAISRLKAIIDTHPDFSHIDEVNQLYETLSKARKRSQSPQENTK